MDILFMQTFLLAPIKTVFTRLKTKKCIQKKDRFVIKSGGI
jgi:hypothetical protein